MQISITASLKRRRRYKPLPGGIKVLKNRCLFWGGSEEKAYEEYAEFFRAFFAGQVVFSLGQIETAEVSELFGGGFFLPIGQSLSFGIEAGKIFFLRFRQFF